MKVLQAEERKRREGRECVSPACRGQGSARTSYLCPQCYQQQLQENNKSRLASERSDQQVFGKSQFFVPVQPASHQSLTRLPTSSQPGLCDKSLNLTNSSYNQSDVPRLASSMVDQDQVEKCSAGLRNVVFTSGSEGQPCRTSGCAFFGSPDTNYLCSKCFSQHSRLVPQASRV